MARSGMGAQEAGEGAVSGWWVGSFVETHADQAGFYLWDPLCLDGTTY